MVNMEMTKKKKCKFTNTRKKKKSNVEKLPNKRFTPHIFYTSSYIYAGHSAVKTVQHIYGIFTLGKRLCFEKQNQQSKIKPIFTHTKMKIYNMTSLFF